MDPRGPFTLGVGHQGRDQLQNVLFAVDIGKGVVVHGLFEVDGVQNLDLVAVIQHCVATFKHDGSFGLHFVKIKIKMLLQI